MDFEPYLKVHTKISVQRKSTKPGQMIHINMILVWCQIPIGLNLKLAQFLAQAQNGL